MKKIILIIGLFIFLGSCSNLNNESYNSENISTIKPNGQNNYVTLFKDDYRIKAPYGKEMQESYINNYNQIDDNLTPEYMGGIPKKAFEKSNERTLFTYPPVITANEEPEENKINQLERDLKKMNVGNGAFTYYEVDELIQFCDLTYKAFSKFKNLDDDDSKIYDKKAKEYEDKSWELKSFSHGNLPSSGIIYTFQIKMNF